MNKKVSAFSIKNLLLGIVLLTILGILGYKAYDRGWLVIHTPLQLPGAPVLLFFNRHIGCDCAKVVYNAANEQINNWTEVARQGTPIIRIDLDRRPDLGKQFRVIRAPALYLLDKEGKILFYQTDLNSDNAPMDLPAFENAIQEYSSTCNDLTEGGSTCPMP